MNEVAARARIVLGEASRPRLPRHARLHFDKARGVTVILVPERVLVPDETAVEVLEMCDGAATLGSLIDRLAEKYAAERSQIAADVIAMLQELADKGYLVDGGGPRP